MNLNKKFDRLRRWGDEKMGAQKTDSDEDFKALEQEMNTRHKGVERLHGSASTHVKHLQDKKLHPETKEKLTPIGNVGMVMNRHGQEMDEQSKFAQCLIGFGHANERLSRAQENYAITVSSNWLEPLDRSLAQMKEYQNSRRKLESRRLAYDTSLNKMQKNKREDYRLEEELRAQKAKYEESLDDVYRRMQDITEAESDLTGDLYNLLEAELAYHDRCRDILLQLKRDWPAGIDTSNAPNLPARPARSRTNTFSRTPATSTIIEDNDNFDPPNLPFRRTSRASSGAASPMSEVAGFNLPTSPSGGIRTALAQRGSMSETTAARPVISRHATDSSIHRLSLRPLGRKVSGGQNDIFADTSDLIPDETGTSSPDRRSSGASSIDMLSRNTSWSTIDTNNATGIAKKAPPPPPPRRDSKPNVKPAPPPPLKRSGLSSSTVPPVS